MCDDKVAYIEWKIVERKEKYRDKSIVESNTTNNMVLYFKQQGGNMAYVENYISARGLWHQYLHFHNMLYAENAHKCVILYPVKSYFCLKYCDMITFYHDV